jgi:hypothetical protein
MFFKGFVAAWCGIYIYGAVARAVEALPPTVRAGGEHTLQIMARAAEVAFISPRAALQQGLTAHVAS